VDRRFHAGDVDPTCLLHRKDNSSEIDVRKTALIDGDLPLRNPSLIL
jgi:hypothetical protein